MSDNFSSASGVQFVQQEITPCASHSSAYTPSASPERVRGMCFIHSVFESVATLQTACTNGEVSGSALKMHVGVRSISDTNQLQALTMCLCNVSEGSTKPCDENRMGPGSICVQPKVCSEKMIITSEEYSSPLSPASGHTCTEHHACCMTLYIP